MGNIVETSSISKYFKQKNGYFCAVKDISIQVEKGEITCILGPSGCGKSTLMKMIAGITGQSEGTISFSGVTYNSTLPMVVRKRIGVVFQTDNLLPWRNVEDNLRLSLELLKLKGPEWDKKIDEKLEMVGLTDYKKALPHELSGGMRQRVGIARAMMHDPELLLMDQPFNALDAITKKIISYFFLNMWKESPKTVFFITNSVDEALLFGKKIYMLSTCPATVEHVIDASGIPIEKRGEDIEKHPEYQRLKNIIRPLLIKATGQHKEACK